MKKDENKRYRNWTLIVYPESAPKNWKSILSNELKLIFAISPLHDKDINPDGSLKKAHWHVLICFEGLKSYEQVLTIAERLNSPVPQICQSRKGLIRYFCHLDNPEKHQYSTSEIKSFGIDVSSLLSLSRTETNQILKEIFDFIDENELYSYRDFLQIVRKIENDDWFDIAVNRNTLAIKEYLKSAKWTDEQN